MKFPDNVVTIFEELIAEDILIYRSLIHCFYFQLKFCDKLNFEYNNQPLPIELH